MHICCHCGVVYPQGTRLIGRERRIASPLFYCKPYNCALPCRLFVSSFKMLHLWFYWSVFSVPPVAGALPKVRLAAALCLPVCFNRHDAMPKMHKRYLTNISLFRFHCVDYVGFYASQVRLEQARQRWLSVLRKSLAARSHFAPWWVRKCTALRLKRQRYLWRISGEQ